MERRRDGSAGDCPDGPGNDATRGDVGVVDKMDTSLSDEPATSAENRQKLHLHQLSTIHLHELVVSGPPSVVSVNDGTASATDGAASANDGTASANDGTASPLDKTSSPTANSGPSLTAVPQLSLTLYYRSTIHTLSLPASSTLQDLAALIHETFSIPQIAQRLLATPPLPDGAGGTLKHPFPPLPIQLVLTATGRPRKLTLLGTPTAELIALRETATQTRTNHAKRAAALQAARRNPPTTSHRRPIATLDTLGEQYTFHSIRPLALPGSDHALALLQRLATDPGIRAAMRQFRFSVGLLTELEPLSHTQASASGVARLLGLNRNRGEVVELRLRTDAGDGWRQYEVVRKTLCHELAHNVHGPHDANFWRLTREIEGVVERYARGRTTVGRAEVHWPHDEEHGVDEGGWVGGSYILGGGTGQGQTQVQSELGFSRREILARAAEARARPRPSKSVDPGAQAGGAGDDSAGTGADAGAAEGGQ